MDGQACQKATEAGVTQLGIKQAMDGFEERQVHYLNGKAEEWIGKGGMFAVGGTYFVARTIQTKSLMVGLPTLGLASAVKTEISQGQALLRLEWRF
jgi:hypothetical protein